MCLYINKKKKNDDLFKGKKHKTFWKVLESNFSSLYYLHKYIAGINKSNRKNNSLTYYEKYLGIVNEGIHVYTSIEMAKFNRKYCKIIVPVICYVNDLVCIGYDEAVFTKVRLERRTIDRINKQIAKRKGTY